MKSKLFLLALIIPTLLVAHEKDRKGMLYCRQIPESLVTTLEKEIKALDPEAAIHWQDKTARHRRTYEFGVSFLQIERTGAIVKSQIPPTFIELRERLVSLFRDYLTEKDPSKYENVIVTLYGPGDGIKAHTDRDYFGPDILLVTIEPDTASVLTFSNGTKQIRLPEAVGRAFLVQGPLRTTWTHELSPVQTSRISIQFRTVLADKVHPNKG